MKADNFEIVFMGGVWAIDPSGLPPQLLAGVLIGLLNNE